MTTTTLMASIDEAEKAALQAVKQQFVNLRSQVLGETSLTGIPAAPTFEQARDSRNKQENGVNLSERGIEIIYRLYDNGASVRKASRMMDISQQAAKWRLNKYHAADGHNRTRLKIDID